MNCRVVNMDLAVAIGLKEAMILQQIHYWITKCGREKEGHKWIYNTHNEWVTQFPVWGKTTIRRTLKSLESLKLIRVGNYSNPPYNQIPWYTINYNHHIIKEFPLCGIICEDNIENYNITNNSTVLNSDTPISNDDTPVSKTDRGVSKMDRGVSKTDTLYTYNTTEEKQQETNNSRCEASATPIITDEEWYEDLGENLKEQVNSFINERIRKGGSSIKNPGGYKRSMIGKIRRKEVSDFKPISDEKLNSLIIGMYRTGCN